MKRQHGATLPLVMLVLLLAGSAYLLHQLSLDQLRQQQQQQTRAALAQAKQALLSYATLYDLTHANQTFGYLPCPDRNGSNGEGSSNPSCGSKNISQLGRFPWRTLEINTVRDGLQQCLWYALAGSFKNNPNTDLLNWDTPSPLRAYHHDGNTPFSDDVVIAVLLAAGPILPNQDRSNANNTPFCRGNYQASNYLESSNQNISLNQLIDGQTTGPINDQLLVLSRKELFNAIKRRPDFPSFVQQLLQQSSTCNLAPVQLNFDQSPISESLSSEVENNIRRGRIPKSCLSNRYAQWQDQLLYARCIDNSPCQQLNSAPCTAIIIFVGEKQTGQQRDTQQQRHQWANYLEGSNLEHFSNGHDSYSGNTQFDANQPSQDLLICQS